MKITKTQLRKIIKEEISRLKEGKYSDAPLYRLADVARRDWKKVSPYAQPYLDALGTLDDINDKYMFDSGSSIVAYFLSNARSWKGAIAKEVKKELNMRLKKAR